LLGHDPERDLVTPILNIENLSLGFGDLTLFDGLSCAIKPGSILAVIGANGSGKSTFVKTLLGLLSPMDGRLEWPTGKPAKIGYLAQLSEFDRRFPIRVRDLAAMGAWQGFNPFAGLNKATRDRVDEALKMAGILDLADQPLHALSGGQLQRTLFSRVIVQDAPLILLDEPFSAVDQYTEQHLLSVIETWQNEGRAVIMVLHDLSAVLDHCTHALLLGNRRASFGTVDDILTSDRLVAQGYMSSSQASWMFRGQTNGGTH
jgi:zinc/manganese transport system ATP-binding protein